jgi:hypothetical protein
VNEPSHLHVDHKRGALARRLIVHAAGFAAVAGITLGVGLPASTATPTVQADRFLSGGTLDVMYSCVGADDATTGILSAFGLNPFPMPVKITSAAVDPSPSPGEAFNMSFTWDFTVDPGVESFSVGLGVTSLTMSNGVTHMTATSGATGSLVGNGASHTVVLGDGSVPIGYTDTFSGPFQRTAAVDDPITFTPGVVTSAVVTNSGTALAISCSPGEGALTVTDQDGEVPSTTTTTRPAVVTTTTKANPTTTPTVAGVQVKQLPRTGSDNLVLVVVALGLIDVGYLALSASQPARRRRATSAR